MPERNDRGLTGLPQALDRVVPLELRGKRKPPYSLVPTANMEALDNSKTKPASELEHREEGNDYLLWPRSLLPFIEQRLCAKRVLSS